MKGKGHFNSFFIFIIGEFQGGLIPLSIKLTLCTKSKMFEFTGKNAKNDTFEVFNEFKQ